MAIPTISEAIARGRLSIYLCGNNNAKGRLFGKRLASPNSQVHIAMITDILSWGSSGGAQTDASLRNVANYLVWLCGKYGQMAQAIIDGSSGGGSVVPGGGIVVAFALDWRVASTATPTAPLAIGQTVITFDGTNGYPDLRGYNIDFFRGGVVQYTTDPGDGSTYYSWNRYSGLFVVSAAAQLDEAMRITPIGGGSGGGFVINTQKAPQTFKVGTTAGAPTAGASTWTNSIFENSYVILTINSGDVYQADMGNGNAYITKVLASDTLTLSNYSGGWQTDDIIEVTLITP